MKFEYTPRWKEELVGTYGGHQFSVLLTMGKMHVYFPSEVTWETTAPRWAKGKWQEAMDAAKVWSESNRIPFEIDQQVVVLFEKGHSGQHKPGTYFSKSINFLKRFRSTLA